MISQREKDIFIIKKFIKILKDKNTPIKIMTSYVGCYNIDIGYYNIDTRCHNFFRRGGAFLSFKISNKKIELWTLNAR